MHVTLACVHPAVGIQMVGEVDKSPRENSQVDGCSVVDCRQEVVGSGRFRPKGGRERSDFQHLGERLSPASCTEQSRAERQRGGDRRGERPLPFSLSPARTAILASRRPHISTPSCLRPLNKQTDKQTDKQKHMIRIQF